MKCGRPAKATDGMAAMLELLCSKAISNSSSFFLISVRPAAEALIKVSRLSGKKVQAELFFGVIFEIQYNT